MSSPTLEAASTVRPPGPVARRDAEPIRGELFGPEHLESHARRVAAASRLARPGRRGQPLRRSFYRIGRDLARAHRRIAAVSRDRQSITPDAEWLLDNY